jgi:hypothetical protein
VLPELRIKAVTPGDPASATLLKTTGGAKNAAKSKARAASAKAATRATVGTGKSTTEKAVRAIRADPFVGIADGRGTVLLTNTGTITYHRAAPAGAATDGSGATVTSLVVTAIPATGGLDAPIVLRFPLKGDLAPGKQVEVPIRLPAIPGVQPSFLVSARLVTADPDEQPTTAAVVFWMRGAPAAPKPIVVSKPVAPAKPDTPAPPTGAGSETQPAP